MVNKGNRKKKKKETKQVVACLRFENYVHRLISSRTSKNIFNDIFDYLIN